jgi:hypothetical protein
MRRLLLALLVLTVGLVGCGDDGGDEGSGDNGETTTSTVEATTTTADPTTEITDLFTEFFVFPEGTDFEAKLAMMEDPDAIRDLFERGRTDPVFAPLLAQVTVDVKTVTVTGEGEADVDFGLLLNGAPATEGTVLGRAVLVDGEWKISNSTLCTLLGLGNPEYNQDPACKVG